jgi:general stress protein YciG
MCEVSTRVSVLVIAQGLFNIRRNTMAGTKAGGKLAAQKNLAKDPMFYAKIGAKGGRNGHTGGFAANPELARKAGAIGGRISRRKKTTVSTEV